MSITDVVQLTITRSARPLERAGFGTLLFLSMHRAWDDLIRYYTQSSQLLDDGFTTSDHAYLAAVSYFSQEPKPQRIAVGRLKTADACLVLTTAEVDGHRYVVWVDGIGFGFLAGVDTTTTLIEAGLTTILNSGYTVTAASPANKTLTIAGNHFRNFPSGEQFRITGSGANNGTYTVDEAELVAGNTVITVVEAVPSSAGALGSIKSLTPITVTNSISWDGMISISPTVASTFFRLWVGENLATNFGLDGTIAANLASIELEDASGWYAVSLAHQWHPAVSPAESETQEGLVIDLAKEVEARRKILLQASSDTDIVNVTLASDDPTTGSVARQAQDRSYARTAILYSAQANDDAEDPYADAAWLGSRLPTDPGRETWWGARLKGASADELSATQRANALAKRANIYTPFTADGTVSIVESGTMADGTFIDVIRLVDAIYQEVLLSVGETLITPAAPMFKIPYTQGGLDAIENSIRKALDKFTGPDRGLSSYTVDVPDIDEISDTDKANRVITGITFVGFLSGAAQGVVIQGNVTV